MIGDLLGDTRYWTRWGEYGLTRLSDAQRQRDTAAAQARQAQQAGDTARAQQLAAEAQQWDEGGAYRTAGHAALGALSDGVQGAAGAAASAALMPEIGQIIDATDAPATVRQGLGMALSAALGGVVGGVQGAASAFNADTNNRQLHPSEKQRIKDLAAEQALVSCRGDAACASLPNVLLYWTDMLERAALERVDARQAGQNQPYYGAIVNLAASAGTEASTGAAQRFFEDLGEAHRLLNASTGRPIVDAQSRLALGSDGQAQTYFAASQAQRDDPYGNIFPGGSPSTQASVVPGMAERDKDRLERMGALNGQTTPNTTLEELVMGVRVPARGAATVVQTTERQVATAVAGTARSVEETLLRSGGMLDKAGNPLLDMSKLTSEQKRVVGEQLFGPNTVRQIVPDGQQIARVQGQGSTGIDELYRVQRPDVDYVSIEYKFVGTDNKTAARVLSDTRDGRQGSTSWITGSNRIENAIGYGPEADAVRDALKLNRVESWAITVRRDGSTTVELLDALGRPKPIGASKIIHPRVNLIGAQP
jgi:filamentous hemagglutinin